MNGKKEKGSKKSIVGWSQWDLENKRAEKFKEQKAA